LAGLILGAALAAPAQAGPVLFPYKDCPKPSYTPAHYWLPGIYRNLACLCGLHEPLYAPLRYPEVPLNIQVTPFPCPSVDPAFFYESRFHGP
jgi:hypothetical protein